MLRRSESMSSCTPVPLRAGGLRCGAPRRPRGPRSKTWARTRYTCTSGRAFPPHPGGERDVKTQSSEYRARPSPSRCLPFDDDRASAHLVVSPARRPRDTGTPRKRLPPRYTYSSGSAPERHRSRRRWTMPGQDRARPGRRGALFGRAAKPADRFCAVPLRPRDRRGTGRRGSSASEWPASAISEPYADYHVRGVEGPWMTGTR